MRPCLRYFAMLFCASLAGIALASPSGGELTPKYKPSSRSPAALDIRQNSYGASHDAPHALQIGDTAPAFSIPSTSGGNVSLELSSQRGPVALIFYRGHW